ncbi:hypothetical protein IF1G_06569 [Cordyceps javanica]|uniref:Uncharacterized protein n=1 Tax=Cordyceps javanica TaxID=43265 RepID=A0A545UYN8_9HYPO|nr:hypothetical protein IF1G_06569 [Cordyceps javanica]
MGSRVRDGGKERERENPAFWPSHDGGLQKPQRSMTEGLLEGRGEKKKGLQGLTIAGYGGRACRWLAGREDANEGRGWVGGKWIVPKTTELLARPAAQVPW